MVSCSGGMCLLVGKTSGRNYRKPFCLIQAVSSREAWHLASTRQMSNGDKEIKERGRKETERERGKRKRGQERKIKRFRIEKRKIEVKDSGHRKIEKVDSRKRERMESQGRGKEMYK